MANQTINIGTTANDGTGDQLRDAFDKTNDNFLEIYTGTASVARITVPAFAYGVAGDIAGMVAEDSTSIWVCHTTYEDAAVPGTTPIWLQADIASSDAHIADATLHRIINDAGTLTTELFSASKIIAELATKAPQNVTINDQTGAAYELVLGDAVDTLVRMDNVGANTLTIPANGAVAFPIGTVIEINMVGAGVTTIGITSDTLNSVAGITTMAQWEVVKLTKVAATEWLAA